MDLNLTFELLPQKTQKNLNTKKINPLVAYLNHVEPLNICCSSYLSVLQPLVPGRRREFRICFCGKSLDVSYKRTAR